MSLQQTSAFQSNNTSLLDNSLGRSEKAFRMRKKERQEVNQEFNVKYLEKKHRKTIMSKGLSQIRNQKNRDRKQSQRKEKQLKYEDSKQSIYYGVDESYKIEFYNLVGQLKQIQTKQKELRKWMSSFICWVTVILLIVIVFYILILKTLFFFNTQLVGTIVQSFKEQIFDPKITNDQLQLQVFYIEQGCFILTVILIFLLILTFTVTVNRYYQKKVEKYRKGRKLIKNLDQRKQYLLTKLKEFKITSSNQLE